MPGEVANSPQGPAVYVTLQLQCFTSQIRISTSCNDLSGSHAVSVSDVMCLSTARHCKHLQHKQSPRVNSHCAVSCKSAKHQRSESGYTIVDNSRNYSVFTPALIDISNLLQGEAPTLEQIRQVQQECAATGFLAITGHDITTEQLQGLFHVSRELFDLPSEVKKQLVVQDMTAGRGYEVSPEHKAYMQEHRMRLQQQVVSHPRAHSQTIITDPQGDLLEPSALDGILSERYCCGRQLTDSEQLDPFFSSELGQVFFPPNKWPELRVPGLQPRMMQCFAQCEVIAAALMGLFAVAQGLPQHFFEGALAGHHSNMQVANYPSQLINPGPGNLRKKAHVDSGTLTLLASEDWLPGSSWTPGDGGLQLLSSSQEWLEVCVPPGALLVNLGSLLHRWTNTLWSSTLHRVTNPPPHKQRNSRRMSMAFFHKPAHDALIEVLPTCYCSSPTKAAIGGFSSISSTAHSPSSWATGSNTSGKQLPLHPLFEPAIVGDLTRQGILHKYRHLPPDEASRLYHEHLAAVRRVAVQHDDSSRV